MTVVVDASVALKWVLDEPGSAAAEALLNDTLIAPSLWLVEAANALWKRVQRKEITPQEAQERLAELFNAPIMTSAIDNDLMSALALADGLGHPVYDCLYLAMALRENTYVITADRRFFNVVESAPTLQGAVRLLSL